MVRHPVVAGIIKAYENKPEQDELISASHSEKTQAQKSGLTTYEVIGQLPDVDNH